MKISRENIQKGGLALVVSGVAIGAYEWGKHDGPNNQQLSPTFGPSAPTITGDINSVTRTPTATEIPAITLTPEGQSSPTATATLAQFTATATREASSTPRATLTAIFTATAESIPSKTPTPTEASKATAAPEPTSTNSPIPTVTSTATETETPARTAVIEPSKTTVPAATKTKTSAETPTFTPVPPRKTAVPPTATATPTPKIQARAKTATPTEQTELNAEALRFDLPESLDSMPAYHIDAGEQPGEEIGHWIYDSTANTEENGWGGAFPWEVNIGSKSEGVTFETDGKPGRVIITFKKGAHLVMALHVPGAINPDTGEIDTGFLYSDGVYTPELGLDMSWNNVDAVTDKILVGRYDKGRYYIDKDHNPLELIPNEDGYVGIKLGAQPEEDQRFFFEITADHAGEITIEFGAHSQPTEYDFSGERFLVDETPVAWKKTVSTS
ncbi:MAG: hypothetical protein Q8Q49_03750 [bacterium]|nr:hypothetical protein [bacterium]